MRKLADEIRGVTWLAGSWPKQWRPPPTSSRVRCPMSLRGHFWTVVPNLRHRALPRKAPQANAWSTTVPNTNIELTGFFRREANPHAALIVLHGLGGSADSSYAVIAANFAMRAGISCLRLNARGADLRGADYGHAGLADDLHAAVASPELADFANLYVIGYSLGGHVALHFACETNHSRVRAVAAICPPINLALGANAIDRPGKWPYRWNVLNGLKEMYRVVATRRSVPISVAEADKITTLREWDARIIAPHHGFANADDYYRRASVAPHLDKLKVPSFAVIAEKDPMVVVESVRPSLQAPRTNLEVAWLKSGGHVGFPPDVDLGQKAPPGLESQVIAWLRQHT